MILHTYRSVALAGLAFCVLMMAVALGLEHIPPMKCLPVVPGLIT